MLACRSALAVKEIIWGIKVLLVHTIHYPTNICTHTFSHFFNARTEQHITWQIIRQAIQIQRPIFRQNKDDKGGDKSSNHDIGL